MPKVKSDLGNLKLSSSVVCSLWGINSQQLEKALTTCGIKVLPKGGLYDLSEIVYVMSKLDELRSEKIRTAKLKNDLLEGELVKINDVIVQISKLFGAMDDLIHILEADILDGLELKPTINKFRTSIFEVLKQYKDQKC